VQRPHSPLGAVVQFADFTELDRVGRTRFGAGGFEPALQPIVAQGAFMRLAVLQTDIDNAKRASRHAITAAIANVLLNDDSVELGAEKRPGRASFETRGRRAMLADIAHHQPIALEGGHFGRALAILGDVLDEMNMPPGGRREVAGIVITGPAQTQSPWAGSHDISRFRSDHGRPCSSAEARFYILRRLAGQAHAQPKCVPGPSGPSGRRARARLSPVFG